MNTHFNTIELNITELCNFKCVFCPRSGDYPNSNLHMSMDVVDKIIEDIKDWGRHFTIFIAGRGEPTLHNNFSELLTKFIDFRDATGLVDICVHTNGAKLDKHLEAMSKLDAFTYNIYDETKSVQQKIKKYKSLKNINFKDKRTSFTKKKFSSRAGSIELDDIFKSKGSTHVYGKMCKKPFQTIYVNWNGDYNLCCDNWKDIVVLSNIFKESLKDYATHNKKLLDYQEDLLSFNRSMHPCSTCDRVFKINANNAKIFMS